MDNNSRPSLGDNTNTAKQADAKDRKRERDRARWQTMSQEEKNAIYKKRRESYHQRKKQEVIGTTNYDTTASNKENIDPVETDDWLHTNNSYQTHTVIEESTKSSNTSVSHVDKTNVQRTSKSNYDRGRYKNMTPEQREARRERQRLHNTEPKRKEAMKSSRKKFIEAQKHTLQSDSIAMENPVFSPKLVWPTADTSIADGSTMKSSAMEDNTPMPQSVVTNNERVGTSLPATSMAPLFDDYKCMDEKHLNDDEYMTTKHAGENTPFPRSTSTNKEIPGTSNQNASARSAQPISDDTDDDEGFDDDEDDEDGNWFAGQEESDDEVESQTTEDGTTSEPEVLDSYESVYRNIPAETHMLQHVPNCPHCGAKRFPKESKGFCCREGQIELAEPVVPDQLMRLYTSSDEDAAHFRNNIRFFNGHFSFTSLYCRLDKATATMRGSGVYTFRANGMIYHNIRSFGKEEGKEPRHLELYFYE